MKLSHTGNYGNSVYNSSINNHLSPHDDDDDDDDEDEDGTT